MTKWGEKPYHSLDYMLRERFGEKVYKVTLNGGMSCPNRDGKIGTRGCIFCSAGGSGDFAADAALSITDQIESQISILSQKRPIHKYIAYFPGVHKYLRTCGISGENFYRSNLSSKDSCSFHRHQTRLPQS